MNYLQNTAALHHTYYVMRHGKSVANEQGLIVSDPAQGVPGFGLAEEGRQQVRQAVDAARRQEILDASTLIVASDFARARETALIARDILGAPDVILTPKLRERYFGAWDGQSTSNYQHVWDDDRRDPAGRAHGVESTLEVLARTTSLIRDLEAAYKETTILLVSHGDALQILQTAFERVPASQHRELAHLETAEIRELRLRPLE